MPIEYTTFLRVYDLPSDGTEAKALLIDLLDTAKHSIHLEIYGWTDGDLADAMARASKRGVDAWALLDHTQSAGPAEVVNLHRLFLAGFPVDRVTITTSTMHQIFHRKRLIIDGKADVPDAQYDTLEAARQAGYPIVCTGSTNWSPTAFKQANDLLVLPGKSYAKVCLTQFALQWDFARSTEPHYQLSASA